MNKTYFVAYFNNLYKATCLQTFSKNIFQKKLYITTVKMLHVQMKTLLLLSTGNMTIITISKGFQFMLIDILKKFLSETHRQTFCVFVLPEMLLLYWEAKNQQNIGFFTVLALSCKREMPSVTKVTEGISASCIK